MRVTVVVLLALACGLGCGDPGDDVAFAPECDDDLGCPTGFRCVEGRYCLSEGGTMGPGASLPNGGTSGGRPIDAGPFPLDGGQGDGGFLDGGFLDGGRFADGGGGASRGDAGRCVGAQVVCGTVCVDLASDSANCGGCGVACTGGAICNAGVCCGAAGTTCGGACVDMLTDPNNCGTCGTVCPQGMECSLGACVPPLPGPIL